MGGTDVGGNGEEKERTDLQSSRDRGDLASSPEGQRPGTNYLSERVYQDFDGTLLDRPNVVGVNDPDGSINENDSAATGTPFLLLLSVVTLLL